MNRADLQQLARIRLNEALLLLNGGGYPGAYYLTGLALECALKACIARATQQHEFPDLKRAQGSWSHDLPQLLGTAGLTEEYKKMSDADKQFEANWFIVKDWRIDSRYDQKSMQEARDIYAATTEAAHGIMIWLERYW